METVLRFAPKQKRASNAKVRTGCATCKQRRIKCDEGKPICIRCEKSNLTCDYPALTPITRRRGGGSANEKGNAPSASSSSRRLLPRPLSIAAAFSTLPGTDKEKIYFQLYRDRVARDLGGIFEMPFFTVLIPRECHNSEIVRHFVIALSGTSKAFSSIGKEKDEEMHFVLCHQAKALSALRTALTNGQHEIRLAVIASAILSSYEGLYSNYQTAQQQLTSGLSLLSTWQATKGSNVHGVQVPSTIDQELLTVFPRLELGLTAYRAMNTIAEEYSERDDEPVEPQIFPEKFADYADVPNTAIKMLELHFRFMRKADRWKARRWPPIFPQSIWQESRALVDNIDAWFKASGPFLQGGGMKGHPAYLMFSVGIGIVRLLHMTGLVAEETVHDQFVGIYERLLQEARSFVIQDLGGRSDTKLQSIVQMIMPLFYIATRCRDPKIRKEALDLIRKYPGRQSVWNSQQLGPLVEWFIRIEEEGEDENGFIPEESRGRLHTLKWVMMDDGLHVEVMQGGVDGVWILRKDILQIEQ